MSIHETLAPLTIPLGSVTRYPGNARAHQLDRLRESLRNNQQYRPIVVNRRTMQILAGNGTHEAAEQEGWTEIAATFVDVDDEQARRILLVDNPPPSHPGYDDEALLELLQSLPDIGGTGYTSDELAELEQAVRGEQQQPGFTDPDEVPEPPAEPVTRPGDLWLLGPHRLLCGDATKAEDVERLVGDKQVGALLADPPYGINLDTSQYAKMRDAGYDWGGGEFTSFAYDAPIHGDAEPFDARPLRAMFPKVAEQFWFGANYYRRTLSDSDMEGSWLVWDKRSEGNEEMWGSKFELIWSAQQHGNEILRHLWVFTTATNIRLGFKREHPTEKPIALLAEILNRWAPKGGAVLDPYAGVGPTLIACQQTGRSALLLEIEARYVDVTCRRYQEHTGEKPLLEATGEPHDFTDLTRGA